MTNFDNQPGHILAFLVAVMVLSLILFSCSSTDDKQTVSIKQKDILLENWKDIFDYEGVVSFRFPDPDQEIYTLGSMRRNSRGNYFIVDGKAKKLLMFDAAGNFKKYIGRGGEGPGEYKFLLTCFIDKNDDLHLYDLQKMQLLRFKYPDYEYKDFIRLSHYYQDMFFTDDLSIIGCSVSDDSVIHKISPDRSKIEKFFTPTDKHFRMFSSRFYLSRLGLIPGKGFLFTYPDEYKIFLYDFNVNIQKTLVARNYNRFIPEPLSYPKDMKPNEFTPKHSKWWSKALKPAMVVYLKDGYFLQVLIKFNNLSGILFANLHHLDGSISALGVEVPFNSPVVFSENGFVYIPEAATLDDANNIVPLRLHKYRLKDLLK